MCYNTFMENYKEIIDARKILAKYDPKDMTENRGSQDFVIDKWRSKFSKGWYGFDMGWAPDNWFKIIDEFLEQIKQVDPDFQIHQIKIKFGGMRIYLSFSEKITEDKSIYSYVNQQISILEHELFHESLIF